MAAGTMRDISSGPVAESPPGQPRRPRRDEPYEHGREVERVVRIREPAAHEEPVLEVDDGRVRRLCSTRDVLGHAREPAIRREVGGVRKRARKLSLAV